MTSIGIRHKSIKSLRCVGIGFEISVLYCVLYTIVMVTVQIFLEDDRNVFHPDCTVSGVVRLNVRGRRPIKALSLRVAAVGAAKTQLLFVDDFFSVDQTEVCLNEKIVLWTKNEANGGVISHGTHEYAFEFRLRPELPASIDVGKAKCCMVSYAIKAQLTRKWMSTVKCKKPFTVVPYVDVNEPTFAATTPSSCQSKDGIFLKASIDQSGYCPGESILVTVEVENNSKSNARGILVELLAKADVRADNFADVDVWSVNDMKGAAVPAGAIERWDAIPLSVPPMAPTTSSRLVDLSYCVRVSVETISAVFPIFIGSVRSESITARWS